MKNQLAVIMFADIVGYSAMMQSDQDKTVDHVRALRDIHLEPVVVAQGGRILKRLGDGWIFSFPAIADCVACAMEVQTGMLALKGVQLRIGCHFGDIVEEGEDVYGSGVNIAARIQAEAPPGGVMISEDMMRQLSGIRADAMKEAGVFRLKNIAQPVRLYQWRPAQERGNVVDDVTSVAVGLTEYAPLDADTAALAGDLRDQLINRMSRRSGVVVYDAASTAVQNTTYDLRSRLRVSGGRGRFSLSLVLRSDGRPVWSESYDRETDDIFAFCDLVLQRAESDLRLQMNAFDGDRLVDIPDDELSVSELRARAAVLFYRGSYQEWVHAEALMERAVGMNPNDGVALAMRAEAKFTLAGARYDKLSEAQIQQLEKDLDLAVEQNSGSDYVLWARGIFRVQCLKDVQAALSDLARTRQLNAAYMEAHELDGHIRMMCEDFEAAAASYEFLLQRQTQDPLIASRAFMRAVALYCAGEFEAAAEQAQFSVDLRPTDRMLLVFSALACDAAGLKDRAARQQAKAAQMLRVPSISGRHPVLPESQRDLSEVLHRSYHEAADIG